MLLKIKNNKAALLERLFIAGLFFLAFLGPISFACANIGMALVIGSWIGQKILSKERRLAPSPLHFWFLLFFTVTFFSLFHSDYLFKSFQGVRRLAVQLLFFFALLEVFCQEKNFHKVFRWITFAALVVTLDGILQYFFGKDPLRQFSSVIAYFPDARGEKVARITATWGNPNGFGIYLAAILPLLIAFAMYGVSFLKRSWVILAVSLGTICLVLTYSRAAVLGVTGAMILFVMVRRNRGFF